MGSGQERDRKETRNRKGQDKTGKEQDHNVTVTGMGWKQEWYGKNMGTVLEQHMNRMGLGQVKDADMGLEMDRNRTELGQV